MLEEVRTLIDELRREDPSFRAEAVTALARDPFEADPRSAIAPVLEAAAADVLGAPPARVGSPYWMDAALLQAAGTDTVVMGPAGAGAHAAEEWVDVASVARLAEILVRVAAGYCGQA